MLTSIPRLIAAAVGLFCCLQTAMAPQPDAISAAVDRYARGESTPPLAGLNATRMTVAELTSVLDRWVAIGEPAGRDKRAKTAVMFSLDVVWATTRSWINATRTNLDPWRRVTPSEPERVTIQSFVAQGLIGRWCAQRLPQTGPVDGLERIAWLATIGMMEDGHAWHAVLDVLPAALARMPEEPRLQLAQVLARTNSDLGSLRVSNTVRPDLLTDENLPSAVTRRIDGAIKALETVSHVPELSGEVSLRAGYLEMRRRRWKDARDRLEAAIPLLREPVLLATADYFIGWIHERMGQSDDAIAAYRRAHAIIPTMRNLSTSLAALLYLRNERDEAYKALDQAFNATEPPDDLLFMLEHGDARFVPAHLRMAREAVR